jgi:GAF domain-containing protein
MTAARARRVAWTAFGLTVLFIPVSLVVLFPVAHAKLSTQDDWNVAGTFVGAVMFSIVGALILSRHPRHAIGWTFTLSGLAASAAVVVMAYGELARTPGWSAPGGQFAWSVATVLVQSGVFIPLTLGLLLFPDGRLLSPRWWPAVATSVIGLLLRLVAENVDPTGKLEPWNTLDTVGVLITVGSTAAGLAALTLRWRQAGSILRQQLKWMAAAATLVVLAFVLDVVLHLVAENLIVQVEFVLFIVVYISIPAAAAASILRYGLYEIDFIINRAIVYAAMTAILAGVYAGFTAALQKLFVAATGQKSDAAIVITVALIATLFTPVRNALQRLVDARFKDRKDLERLLASLESEVGAVVDVIYGPRLAERLVKTAREGAGATGAAVFLGDAAGDAPAYTAGDWTGLAELVVPLRAGDRELGRIALTARRHGAPYTDREKERLQQAADMVAMGLSLAHDESPRLAAPISG